MSHFLKRATGAPLDSRPIPRGISLAGSAARGTMYYSAVDEEAAMPTTQSNRRLNYDDFLLFPDDGKRHEIIDGVHYVTPCPTLSHQELVGRLHLSIGSFVEDRPERGRVILAPFDVVFSFHDIVEPDLVFVAPDQYEILDREEHSRHTGARHRSAVAVDAAARLRNQTSVVRAHGRSRVLGRGWRRPHGHGLSSRAGCVIPAGGRPHRRGSRHPRDAALAGMVPVARASLSLEPRKRRGV